MRVDKGGFDEYRTLNKPKKKVEQKQKQTVGQKQIGIIRRTRPRKKKSGTEKDREKAKGQGHVQNTFRCVRRNSPFDCGVH